MSTQIMQSPFPRAKNMTVHETRVFARRPVETLDSLFVHQECGNGSLKAVSRYHSNPNHVCKKGCPGYLYHWGIPFEGLPLQCNDLESKVYSTYKVKRISKRRQANEWAENNILKWGHNMNNKSLSVMFVGAFDGPGYKGSHSVTESQILALTQLICWVTDPMRPWSISRQAVLGHCHVRKLACPGFVVTDFIEKIVWDDAAWSKHLVNSGITTEINVSAPREPERVSLFDREQLTNPEEELQYLLSMDIDNIPSGEAEVFVVLLRKAFMDIPEERKAYWLKKMAEVSGMTILETLRILTGFNTTNLF